MLHRITYLRAGSPRSVTFAGDLAEAAEFEALWESVTKCEVLTRKIVAAKPLSLPRPKCGHAGCGIVCRFREES